MGLHRAHRQSQRLRDLLVGLAAGDVAQHVAFALRQHGGWRRGLRQAHRDRSAEIAAACHDRVDGGDDLMRRFVLQQIAARTGLDRLHHVFGVVVHGQHQHRDLRVALVQQGGQFQPAHAGHVQVHQRQVRQGASLRVLGQAGGQEGLGGGGVAGFAHHPQLRHGFQAQPQPVPHQRVVVDQQQPDGVGLVVHASELAGRGAAGSGSQACSTVPWEVERKVSVPDSAFMRSRILRRPMPRRGSCCTSA